MHKLFITGTDTDAGKTRVATILLQKAQSQGLTCFGLKPIAAGCEWNSATEEWHNDDALQLQAASHPQQGYHCHNPIALAPAIAPHIAAELESMPLSVSGLIDQCQQGLAQEVDFHLVEGAGGWLVPLNNQQTLADFAQVLADDYQYQIVLVVGMKLGCINHALLSQQLILASGLTLAGWVANHIDPNMSEQEANFDYLQQHIQAPCLGRVPYSPNHQAIELIEHIQLPRSV